MWWISLCKPITFKQGKTDQKTFYDLTDIPGTIAGMSGLMSIVVQVLHHHEIDMIILTVAFGTTVLFSMFVILLPCIRKCSSGAQVPYSTWLATGLGRYTILFIFITAFYGDLALGMVADNLIGRPTGKLASLSWIYFAAKRLILFLGCF
ncbi:hypothetical protein P691DRAFT_679575 [Macrolepiota fuliginosa MF-IS2]|uniref:Uncharacterized protein n=1 Tax=Macrolepiota fuliginosa MF-IS2 TaxID=1400762 RepID=A0A9P5X4U7_9AGAR|nr:hypothetical protein P691DRAFT_679575 [Macrolepiota fuliginosa MF-IS2]